VANLPWTILGDGIYIDHDLFNLNPTITEVDLIIKAKPVPFLTQTRLQIAYFGFSGGKVAPTQIVNTVFNSGNEISVTRSLRNPYYTPGIFYGIGLNLFQITIMPIVTTYPKDLPFTANYAMAVFYD